MPAATRRELADTIAEEATRLNRLVGDLLDMTRLESGALALRREWHSLEEIVGGVLERLERAEPGRHVALHAAPTCRSRSVDEVLLGPGGEQPGRERAAAHAAGAPIEVAIAREGDAIAIDVPTAGPGCAPGEETRVFEKFYRGAGRRDRHGAGLGLTICRGIVEAHGGTRHRVAPRPGGGAVFRIRLPIGGDAADDRPRSRASREEHDP